MIRKSLFLKINTITLGSVLVLILVGSIVRSMGAGMGCPDWPKCFGSYVPPTSSEQLPENYLEVFKQKRLVKNKRLAAMLTSFGYGNLGNQILDDPSIQVEHEFSVTKAWIEYVNRLVGVVIGLLVFLNMIWAFSIKKNRWIPIVGILIFVLTGFQGWVGSLVVSTNLLKGFITFHMLLALLIVALLIWMQVRVRELVVVKNKYLFLLVLVSFLFLIPQILLGTEVRHIVDGLLVNESNRSVWVESLTTVFLIHRSYSWIVLLGVMAIFVLVRQWKVDQLKRSSSLLFSLVIATAIAGIVMTEFSFPFWTQPIHLLLASGIFSVLFYLILRLKFAS